MEHASIWPIIFIEARKKYFNKSAMPIYRHCGHFIYRGAPNVVLAVVGVEGDEDSP
jgi:hypothetical protein